ncbi:MAG: SgcJ/EcaC family oxidoreductase [Verrucomicrobiota bacterium]
MKPLPIAAFFLALTATAFSQEKNSDAQALAESQNSAYTAAFNEGNAESLAALFTEDARYALGAGDTIVGREEIQARASAFFEQSNQRSLQVTVSDARFLTPDVLVETGLAIMTVDDQSPGSTSYHATHVRVGDDWLIAELHETNLPSADRASEALSQLNWLIGSWSAKGEGWSASSKATWTLNGRFIARSFSIKRDDETEGFEGAEVIGYDSQLDIIRSWSFDNEGAHGQATWTNEGNKWLVQTRSTLPDGVVSSAEHVYTDQDDGKYTVASINRMIDGQALPNTDPIEVTRTEE